MGLLFSTVGMEPVASQPRFSFGIFQLESGIPITTLAIGMLAAAEIVRQAIDLTDSKQASNPH
jgi:putative tricarboxylic transport membrane protein